MRDATPSQQRAAEIAAAEAAATDRGLNAWQSTFNGETATLDRVEFIEPCRTLLCTGVATGEDGVLRLPGHPMDGGRVVRGPRMCAACKQRKADREAQLAAQVEETRITVDELIPRAEVQRVVIPHRYEAIPADERTATWEGVPEKHRRLLADWPTDPDSIYLHGPSGAGKTKLAARLVMDRLDLVPSTIIAWRNVSVMFERIRRTIRKPDLTEELIEGAIAADILVLDDLGAETSTRWLLDRLYVVIEERISHQRVTIITSNHHITGLRDHLIDVKDRHPTLGAAPTVKTPEEIAADRLISRIRGKHRYLVPLDRPDQRIHGPKTTTNERHIP